MEVNGPSLLDAMEIYDGHPIETQRLVPAGAVFLLRDLCVQVRLQDHLIAVRKEISRQPHQRWCFGGRKARGAILEQEDCGDDAGDGADGQDDQDVCCLGERGLFGHVGCFLQLALRVPSLRSKKSLRAG